jgi:peptidoglycan hydrolase CwlO-like protein
VVTDETQEKPKRGRKSSPLTAAIRKWEHDKKRIDHWNRKLEDAKGRFTFAQEQLQQAKEDLAKSKAELDAVLSQQ